MLADGSHFDGVGNCAYLQLQFAQRQIRVGAKLDAALFELLESLGFYRDFVASRFDLRKGKTPLLVCVGTEKDILANVVCRYLCIRNYSALRINNHPSNGAADALRVKRSCHKQHETDYKTLYDSPL